MAPLISGKHNTKSSPFDLVNGYTVSIIQYLQHILREIKYYY